MYYFVLKFKENILTFPLCEICYHNVNIHYSTRRPCGIGVYIYKNRYFIHTIFKIHTLLVLYSKKLNRNGVNPIIDSMCMLTLRKQEIIYINPFLLSKQKDNKWK